MKGNDLLKEVLLEFLLEYLKDSGAIDYFPNLNQEDWYDSLDDFIVDRFREKLLKLNT